MEEKDLQEVCVEMEVMHQSLENRFVVLQRSILASLQLVLVDLVT
jgi:hypothetical protein